MTFIPLGKTAKHAKRTRHAAHFAGLHVAQEARRAGGARADDQDTQRGDSTVICRGGGSAVIGATVSEQVRARAASQARGVEVLREAAPATQSNGSRAASRYEGRASNARTSSAEAPAGGESPSSAGHEPPIPTLTDVVADPRVAPQLTLLELRTLRFDLPMPVSVNGAWRSPTRKEIISGISPERKFLRDDHKQYRTNVISNVRRVMRTDRPLLGRVELRVALHFNNERVCDIDNRVKPLQDALTHAQAYVDDSQVDRLIVERIIDTGAEYCAVTITEIAA